MKDQKYPELFYLYFCTNGTLLAFPLGISDERRKSECLRPRRYVPRPPRLPVPDRQQSPPSARRADCQEPGGQKGFWFVPPCGKPKTLWVKGRKRWTGKGGHSAFKKPINALCPPLAIKKPINALCPPLAI